MRNLLLFGLLPWLVTGCMGVRPFADPMGPPVPVYCDNPLLLPIRDPFYLWEGIVDVVDDYFRIEREEPVKVIGDTLTEGRLDTYPRVGSTLLEPWRHDSADEYEKVESTLQSIRRTAQIRVTPSEGGFLVEVAVYKELEDVKRPAHATAGAATFRTEGSLTRVVSPIGEQEVNQGWIPLGRDRALEQRMLAHLQERLRVQGLPPMPAAVPATAPATEPGASPATPAAPSAPAGCRFGQRNTNAEPQERTVYRLQLSDADMDAPPGIAWLPGLGRADTPAFPRPSLLQSVAADGDDSLDPTPLDSPIGPGAGALADFGPEEAHRLEPIGARWRREWRPGLAQFLREVKGDYGEFYSRRGLALAALGMGAAATLANTSADENFQRWHDDHVFTHDVSRFAYVTKVFGAGQYLLPFFALCTVAQPEYEPGSVNWMVAEWGRRSLRSFLVGAPLVGGFQWALGGTRPEDELPDGSHWRLFGKDGHAVSGHAFIGGITFLNAAEMTDNVFLKSAFYVASILPGWSRVIQDDHYLSQVIWGWWFAYLSTRAVVLTDPSSTSEVIVAPVVMENGGFGIGLLGAW